jgi:hypothetical protein
MKQLLVILLGAVAGFAHAQSVNWSAAWAGCSAESRAFDAVAQGSSTNSQGVRGWVESHTGSPYTNIEGLQRKLQEDRELLRSHQDPVIRASAHLAICGSTAALRQLQYPAVASSSAAASPTVEPSSQGNVRGCMKQNNATSSFSNQCNMRVNLSWCAVPHSASDSSNQHCESQRFSSHELSPGDSVRVDEGALIAWFACPAPRRPGDLKYVSGTGLMGRCLR